MLHVEILDGIVQTTRSTHHRHGTIFQTVNLIQPAGFVARRHQENIGAGFHLMCKLVVVCEFETHTPGVGVRQRAKQILVAAFARAQHHQRHILIHQFVRAVGDQVKSLLVGKPRNNGQYRAMRIVIHQAKRRQQILFTYLLA